MKCRSRKTPWFLQVASSRIFLWPTEKISLSQNTNKNSLSVLTFSCLYEQRKREASFYVAHMTCSQNKKEKTVDNPNKENFRHSQKNKDLSVFLPPETVAFILFFTADKNDKKNVRKTERVQKKQTLFTTKNLKIWRLNVFQTI